MKIILTFLILTVFVASLNATKDPCKTGCPEKKDPVCGFDGNQYQIFKNPCYLDLANCDQKCIVWYKRSMKYCTDAGCKPNHYQDNAGK